MIPGFGPSEVVVKFTQINGLTWINHHLGWIIDGETVKPLQIPIRYVVTGVTSKWIKWHI